MAGLSVLLEPHSKSHPGGKAAAAQVISKATLAIHGASNHKQKQKQVPAVAVPPAAGSSFLQLQRCCLCHRELADGMDIYMYRGDRAFCSEECRCRQIFLDEDDAASDGCGSGAGAGAGAATVRGSRRVAGRGRVTY